MVSVSQAFMGEYKAWPYELVNMVSAKVGNMHSIPTSAQGYQPKDREEAIRQDMLILGL